MNQSTPLLKNPPSSPTSSWYEIQLLPMAYETQDLASLLGSPTSSVPLCPNHDLLPALPSYQTLSATGPRSRGAGDVSNTADIQFMNPLVYGT